jgi:hypothetical protein
VRCRTVRVGIAYELGKLIGGFRLIGRLDQGLEGAFGGRTDFLARFGLGTGLGNLLRTEGAQE